MNKKFTVEVCSDLNYEKMVADISYADHSVAMIIQDKGIHNMEIKFFCKDGNQSSFLPYDDFIRTLEFAKKTLIEMQKLPDEITRDESEFDEAINFAKESLKEMKK